MKKVKLRAMTCKEHCEKHFEKNGRRSCAGCSDSYSDGNNELNYCESYRREPNPDKPYKTKEGKYIIRRV